MTGGGGRDLDRTLKAHSLPELLCCPQCPYSATSARCFTLGRAATRYRTAPTASLSAPHSSPIATLVSIWGGTPREGVGERAHGNTHAPPSSPSVLPPTRQRSPSYPLHVVCRHLPAHRQDGGRHPGDPDLLPVHTVQYSTLADPPNPEPSGGAGKQPPGWWGQTSSRWQS